METMTRNRVQTLLSRPLGAIYLSVLTATETKMNKTNNPFWGKVFSIRMQNIILNYHYENAAKRNIGKKINAKREKEGLEPLSGLELENAVLEHYSKGDTWYNTIADEKGRITPFCEGKSINTEGQIYYRARELHKGETVYVASEDIEGYPFRAGDIIPRAAIELFCPSRKSNKYEVEARTYKLNSVRAIRYNKQLIKVIPSKDQETVPLAVLRVADAMIDRLPDPQAA